MAPTGKDGQRLVQYASKYLTQSEVFEREGKYYASTGSLAAAEAFFRAADHLQHMSNSRPEPKKREMETGEVNRHLERVYLRLKQCEFFTQQSGDDDLNQVCGIAKGFYQLGVRAAERGELRTADEYTKASDDLTHAVESVAQAAAPEGKIPLPPRP